MDSENSHMAAPQPASLDELDLERLTVPRAPVMANPHTRAKPPHGFRYWYDSMCDVMFENPDFNLKQVAEELGRSVSWVYVVAKSDSFKAHYEQRRLELNERITSGITQRASNLAMKSLDALLQKMDDNPQAFNIGTHLEVVNSTTKLLGMGQKQGPQVSVNVQQTVVPAATQSELARARELIRASEQARLAQPLPMKDPSTEVEVVPGFDGELLELEAEDVTASVATPD